MLTEPEKHAAEQAVFRYGANRARVDQTLQAVRQAQAQGHDTDLLEALVAQGLLTPTQARQIRLSLDDTHIDPELLYGAGPTPPVARPSANGDVLRDQEDLVGAALGLELRTLGDYRILAVLGEGGMGAVFRAYHEQENRQVAIKVLGELLARNPSYLERFQRETQSVARLNHPNIVKSFGAGQDQATGKHYLVLEYVDGPSAEQLLEEHGPLAVGDAIHIILDVARALEHAHSRRIIHRDIKPDNILLTKSGVAKLSDLGLAKQTDEVSHLTATRQGFGTPYYMPYEQALNARQADARSDIFALGATLYHLVTGEYPFPGVSHLEIVEKKELGKFLPASTHRPDLPAELDRILAKMLAREPRHRYQTASELIVDLDRSRLAVPVLSFVDADVALQDPVVRARLTDPPQQTQPDLAAPLVNGTGHNGPPNGWFVRYRNKEGRPCKTRLTTEEILSRLAQGRLTTPTVEAARAAQGDFLPLSEYPEFRDHLAAALEARRKSRAADALNEEPEHKERRPTPPKRWSSWGIAFGLALLLGILSGLVYLWLFAS